MTINEDEFAFIEAIPDQWLLPILRGMSKDPKPLFSERFLIQKLATEWDKRNDYTADRQHPLERGNTDGPDR